MSKEKKKQVHFQWAKKIILSWPEWKQEIAKICTYKQFEKPKRNRYDI